MNKLSDQDKIKITELYHQGHSCQNIGEMFHCTKNNIRQILVNRQVKLRNNGYYSLKHKLKNLNLFKEIDQPETAQILGLIFADGHHSTTRNQIIVKLQEQDKEYLEDIRKYLGLEQALQFVNYKKYNSHNQNQYKLIIGGKETSHDFSKLGITNKKTRECKYPNVPPELNKYFIRGFFEGDGHISYHGEVDRYTCGMVGTLEFLANLQKIIKQETNIDTKIVPEKRSKFIYYLSILGGHKMIYKFLLWIYSGNINIVMRRKYQYLSLLYNKILNHYKHNQY